MIHMDMRWSRIVSIQPAFLAATQLLTQALQGPIHIKTVVVAEEGL